MELQNADHMEKKGDAHGALVDYQSCQKQLNVIKKNYPEWEPRIVNYRLKYIGEKIALIQGKLNPSSHQSS